MQTEFLQRLSRNWAWVVLRGALAVLFGVMAIFLPHITLAVLVIVWGAYALADGMVALIAAWRVRDQGRPFWALLIVGLLGIGAGVVTFMWPAITAIALLLVIAAWAVVMGICEVVAAIRLRREIRGEWLLGLSGLLSVVLGLFLIVQPGAGALALIWVIGIYAIVFGVLLITLGLRLRKHALGTAAPAYSSPSL
jgi:uncharacterized membrane protein HdeD (DUF308 family)